MKHAWRLTKERESTKQRFLRELKDQKSFQTRPSKSWLRERHNFFPLLMIGVFVILIFSVKIFLTIQSPSDSASPVQEESVDEKTMDYEEAIDIFGNEK